MIKAIFNKICAKFYCKLTELKSVKYRLKGYKQIVVFNDTEINMLKLKVLPLYNYLESYNRRNSVYTLFYTITLTVLIIFLFGH